MEADKLIVDVPHRKRYTLVLRCRNREQLEQLEAAIGGKPQQQPLGPLQRTEELDGAERLSTMDALLSAPSPEHTR